MIRDCPLRLVRRDIPATVDAALLFTPDFAPLAAACVRCGGRTPTVFAVRGGFLLVPAAGSGVAPPGAVKLRRLAGDLYIPADADLLPALLPDEMVGLTRDRGLVILPGGEALAFNPAAPLLIHQWLAPARVERGEWHPFPSRPGRAERLRSIEGPPAPVAVDVLLQGAPPDADPLPGSGEASEGVPVDARPPAGSPGRRVAEGARLGLGRFLAWLGRNLRAPGLAKLGGNLARKALERVPRLTEKVLGAQEAALREVLRQLQSGDVEKALRRAPIGTRDPRYALRDLLGSGGGAATGWLGGGDVWARLAEEYRRLAQEAARRGDHRRAAYLYGVLLRDPRSAANVLMAGGLYRDAAVLFRDRLRDEAAAAAAFEQAGDYDEALRLYDKVGDDERAAHLLRRLGDEPRAVLYFLRAADKLSVRGRHLAAGDLVRTKAGRGDLALAYFRRGWEGVSAEAITCGERLLDEYLVTGARKESDALLAEARVSLAPPRTADAGRFFNYALKVGEDFLPADERDDLADRVRLFFAEHLRARNESWGRAADAAGALFGRGDVWPAPVSRDAAFATRKPERRPTAPTVATLTPVRIADGTVRAVATARDTNDLVVATTTSVVCWRANTGQVAPVLAMNERDVLGLATDPGATFVYVLFLKWDRVVLRCCWTDPAGRFGSVGHEVELDGVGDDSDGWTLQPATWHHQGQVAVTVSSSGRSMSYVGPYLREEPPGPFPLLDPWLNLLAVTDDRHAWAWEGRAIRYQTRGSEAEAEVSARHWPTPWLPGVPEGSPLACPHVDWLSPAPGIIEVAGVDRFTQALYWSAFDARGGHVPSQTCSTHEFAYVAACLVAPGKLAAVTAKNEVSWLRVAGSVLRPLAPQVKLPVPTRAVALAARSTELLVVLEDGSVIRLPRP